MQFRFALAAALLLLAVVAGNSSGSPSVPVQHAPSVSNGVLDASRWNFSADGAVTLGGSWLFSDISEGEPTDGRRRLAHVPGPWPVTDESGWLAKREGVAHFRVKLMLPDVPAGERLAINTGYWMSAYKVVANGQVITKGGQIGKSSASEWANPYARIAALPDGAREIDLEIVVSNHMNRFVGSSVAPVIGLESALLSQSRFLETLSIFLIGAMVFGALYHCVLHALDRRDSANFWFAIFAALLAVRTVAIAPLAGYTVDYLEQYWVWRVNYATTMLLLPVTFQFFLASFPNQFREADARWLWWCFGILAAATFLSGPIVGEVSLKILQFYCVISIFQLSMGLFRSYRSGVQGASIALLGWLLCAGTAVHDILMSNGIIASVNLIPYGFMGFFLCLSGMLASRHQDAYRQARHMTSRLQTLNEELEVAVQNRTVELEEKLEELRANQSALQQAREDAVSANIAKSRFLATMSHELRTPLNSILGFSEFIRDEKLGAVGDARYCEYAGHIHESGEHLLELISDILDLSRIETGKLVLRFEEVRIPDVIEAAIAKAATRERRAGDCVTVNVSPSLPMVHADSRAVTQMVINLVSNALKFTPDEGSVTLTAFQRADGGVTIEVADTGIGMAPEEIPRAIAAFSQIDNNLSRRHEGTGLGLTIVNAMMQQHGGVLAIDSEKGRGTRIRLEFPTEKSINSGGELSARAG
jgi:signal transduction histidine kinase